MSNSGQSNTVDIVRVLRKETSAPLKHCLSAVKEANGDLDKSRSFLYKILSSDEVRLKLASRQAKHGALFCSIDDSSKVGVIVKVNCETDFVALTDQFQQTVRKVGVFFLSNDNCNTLEDLNNATFNEEYTVRQLLNIAMSILGERIFISDLVKLKCEHGFVVPYRYKANSDDYPEVCSRASIISVNTNSNKEFISYLASHVCQYSPSVVNVEDLDQSKLQSIAKSLSDNNNDDSFVKEKMEEYYAREVLYKQNSFFNKDQQTITKTIGQECKEMGVQVYSFKKLTNGES